MDIKKNVKIARNILIGINFAVVLFMSEIIYKTTELICSNNSARDFLEKIRFIPTVPWKVPIFTGCLLIVLFFGIIIRGRLHNRSFLLITLCILDLIISIAITYYLNMSYKGIMLISIANIVIYIEGKKKKFTLLIISIIIYIFLSYDIFSISYNLFSINDYIGYYTVAERFYIFSIENILLSLNEVVFIILMIFIIQAQVDEKTQIKSLYEKLFRTAQELEIANIQLQQYSQKSEEMVKTKERNRLAREIHDTLGHSLTGISTGLEACTELINWDVERTKIQLLKISKLAKKGLLDVRRSVRELRPDTLERFSLILAIQKLCEDINGCTEVNIEFNIGGEVPKCDADEEETIYRVVQESITNAVRHGNAKNVEISLRFENGYVNLCVIDDGKGCDVIKEGFGLKHMRERVEMLRGDITFINRDNKGFVIKVEIPIRWG